MASPDPLLRLLGVLQPALAMYIADSGIWSYPGKESLKLALADLVGDHRNIIERAALVLDERGVVAPKAAYPIGFTGIHDADLRWLVPRVVGELRSQAAAIDAIVEAARDDVVAADLAREAKATSLRHLEILEQSAAAAA